MIILDLSEGMDRGKSGKSRGILKWMISGKPENDLREDWGILCRALDKEY